METQSISKNLVYQRKLKGYTQEELSEKTQVTVRTIQRIEKGEVTPHLQTVKLLATALHIEVEDLIPLEMDKKEEISVSIPIIQISSVTGKNLNEAVQSISKLIQSQTHDPEITAD